MGQDNAGQHDDGAGAGALQEAAVSPMDQEETAQSGPLLKAKPKPLGSICSIFLPAAERKKVQAEMLAKKQKGLNTEGICPNTAADMAPPPVKAVTCDELDSVNAEEAKPSGAVVGCHTASHAPKVQRKPRAVPARRSSVPASIVGADPDVEPVLVVSSAHVAEESRRPAEVPVPHPAATDDAVPPTSGPSEPAQDLISDVTIGTKAGTEAELPHALQESYCPAVGRRNWAPVCEGGPPLTERDGLQTDTPSVLMDGSKVTKSKHEGAATLKAVVPVFSVFLPIADRKRLQLEATKKEKEGQQKKQALAVEACGLLPAVESGEQDAVGGSETVVLIVDPTSKGTDRHLAGGSTAEAPERLCGPAVNLVDDSAAEDNATKLPDAPRLSKLKLRAPAGSKKQAFRLGHLVPPAAATGVDGGAVEHAAPGPVDGVAVEQTESGPSKRKGRSSAKREDEGLLVLPQGASAGGENKMLDCVDAEAQDKPPAGMGGLASAAVCPFFMPLQDKRRYLKETQIKASSKLPGGCPQGPEVPEPLIGFDEKGAAGISSTSEPGAALSDQAGCSVSLTYAEGAGRVVLTIACKPTCAAELLEPVPTKKKRGRPRKSNLPPCELDNTFPALQSPSAIPDAAILPKHADDNGGDIQKQSPAITKRLRTRQKKPIVVDGDTSDDPDPSFDIQRGHSEGGRPQTEPVELQVDTETILVDGNMATGSKNDKGADTLKADVPVCTMFLPIADRKRLQLEAQLKASSKLPGGCPQGPDVPEALIGLDKKGAAGTSSTSEPGATSSDQAGCSVALTYAEGAGRVVLTIACKPTCAAELVEPVPTNKKRGRARKSEPISCELDTIVLVLQSPSAIPNAAILPKHADDSGGDIQKQSPAIAKRLRTRQKKPIVMDGDTSEDLDISFEIPPGHRRRSSTNASHPPLPMDTKGKRGQQPCGKGTAGASTDECSLADDVLIVDLASPLLGALPSLQPRLKSQGARATKPQGPVSAMFLSVQERKRQRQEQLEKGELEKERQLQLQEEQDLRLALRLSTAAPCGMDTRAPVIPASERPAAAKKGPTLPLNPFFLLKPRSALPPGAASDATPAPGSSGGSSLGQFKAGSRGREASKRLDSILRAVNWHVRQLKPSGQDPSAMGTACVHVSLRVSSDGRVSLDVTYPESPEPSIGIQANAQRTDSVQPQLSAAAPGFSWSDETHPATHPQPALRIPSSMLASWRFPLLPQPIAPTSATLEADHVSSVAASLGTADTSHRLLQELANSIERSGRADFTEHAELMDVPSEGDVLQQLMKERDALIQRIGSGASSSRQEVFDVAAGDDSSVLLPHDGKQAPVWPLKYRPQKADQVCGNAASVQSLMSWLSDWMARIESKADDSATEVSGRAQGASKRTSAGQRSEFEDEDYDSELAWGDTDDDAAAEVLGRGADNAIVLAGPVGSGKTAAIQACAKELGFSIIEVNPTQDRSGAQLARMVGEATQSRRLAHMAAKIDTTKAPAAVPAKCNPPSALFSKSKDAGGAEAKTSSKKRVQANAAPSTSEAKKPRGGKPRKHKHATVVDDNEDDANEMDGAHAPQHQQPTTRSNLTLMLFEEADVLADEDRGFASTLTALIQDSKRPIVLCVNTRCAPAALASIGVTVLPFEPPSEADLVRLSALVCAAESSLMCAEEVATGCRVSQQLEAAVKGPEELSLSTLRSIVRCAGADIRRSLMMAQFWTSGSLGTSITVSRVPASAQDDLRSSTVSLSGHPSLDIRQRDIDAKSFDSDQLDDCLLEAHDALAQSRGSGLAQLFPTWCLSLPPCGQDGSPNLAPVSCTAETVVPTARLLTARQLELQQYEDECTGAQVFWQAQTWQVRDFVQCAALKTLKKLKAAANKEASEAGCSGFACPSAEENGTILPFRHLPVEVLTDVTMGLNSGDIAELEPAAPLLLPEEDLACEPLRGCLEGLASFESADASAVAGAMGEEEPCPGSAASCCEVNTIHLAAAAPPSEHTPSEVGTLEPIAAMEGVWNGAQVDGQLAEFDQLSLQLLPELGDGSTTGPHLPSEPSPLCQRKAVVISDHPDLLEMVLLSQAHEQLSMCSWLAGPRDLVAPVGGPFPPSHLHTAQLIGCALMPGQNTGAACSRGGFSRVHCMGEFVRDQDGADTADCFDALLEYESMGLDSGPPRQPFAEPWSVAQLAAGAIAGIMLGSNSSAPSESRSQGRRAFHQSGVRNEQSLGFTDPALSGRRRLLLTAANDSLLSMCKGSCVQGSHQACERLAWAARICNLEVIRQEDIIKRKNKGERRTPRFEHYLAISCPDVTVEELAALLDLGSYKMNTQT